MDAYEEENFAPSSTNSRDESHNTEDEPDNNDI
jgi:hypothetical protein